MFVVVEEKIIFLMDSLKNKVNNKITLIDDL